MDINYLKNTVGEPLGKCLAEVCEKRPRDPIEYISHWLYKYNSNKKYEEEKAVEAAKLLEEKIEYALEMERQELRRLETERLRELEAERRRAEAEQRAKEEAERLEAERLLEEERLENERLEAERLAAEAEAEEEAAKKAAAALEAAENAEGVEGAVPETAEGDPAQDPSVDEGEQSTATGEATEEA